MPEPLTDQQLDDIERAVPRLTEYVEQSDAVRVVAEGAPALLAEVRRLRTELAREERLHGGTVDDRDQAQEIADKLAYAVAPVEVIGEHSSMNCPWTNALELITSKADVDKLRARVAEMQPDADLLEALRAYGVDNWDGYDEAIQAAESASS